MLIALTVLAFGLTPDAHAEQAFVRTRSLFTHRMDVGDNHSCAIAADGTLRCWGNGANGRLGYGNTNNIGDNEAPSSIPPVYLGQERTAVQVSAGSNHTCALLDNRSLRCWGGNQYGQLGYGNTIQIGDDETPGSVGTVNVGNYNTVVQVVTGISLTCVLLDNGTVKCWGVNGAGQLGYGTTAISLGTSETPASLGVVDLGAGRTATQLAAGGNFVCALLDNGSVRCWGSNTYGQLGIGSAYGNVGDNETPGSVPPVELAGRTAVAITAGGTHACAILENGSVKCWGNGAQGKLGYGNINNVFTPSSVSPVELGTGRTAVAISAGSSHTCAVLDNGTVKCWGSNTYGQLGYGNTTVIGDDETPAAVTPVDLGNGRLAVAVSAGENHSCALLDDGSMRCWGYGAFGALGYGNTNNIGDNETPGSMAPVSLGSAHGALEVAAGASHSCALMGEGHVYCWGSGSSGRLGYGNTNTIGDNETPASAGPVDLGSHGAVEIAAGESHTCALLANGSVYCWGSGSSGRLGYGNTNTIGDNETPASAGPVELGSVNAIAISAGNQHTCVLLANGTVKCWGSGSFGRLGYGNTTTIGDNETPASVGLVELGTASDGTGKKAIGISAGGFHTCAMLEEGAVRCWGYAGSGALGSGNTNNIGDTETPASIGVVSDGGNANGLATGTEHSCVLLTGGAVRCWGLAAYGQLGYGNTNNIGDNELPSAVEPVPIEWGRTGTQNIGESTVALAAGGHDTCALLATGLLKCWGNNEFGQLGDASTANIGDNETPLSTSSLNVGGSVAGVAVGNNHVCANLADGTVRCWGQNTSGQLGNANTINVGDNETPVTYGPTDLYDDPPVAVVDSVTTNEDTAAPIEVLVNDTDVDGGLKLVESKTNGTHGSVSITGGGTGVTYTPEANYCGSDSFTYTLNGGSTATVSVSITCVDDPPVAVNDAATVLEDSSGTAVDVLSNDTDIDGGPKQIVGKTNGAHGTVAITGGGTGFVYTPEANYCGPDSFTYELNGGSKAAVSVNVICVDDPPVAVNDSKTLQEDSSATEVNVLANDTDIDGGPKSVASKTEGAHGSVAITGGGSGLTYTPNPNYCGEDSFTYELNGGSKATVSVTVNCVDDPPVAVNDSATVVEDSSGTAIDALSNDTDIDGGPKQIAGKTNGAHGTVAITGGGTGFVYTPEANYCGPDSFTYELNGGSKATVSATVTCVDDPPVAVNDAATVVEDSSATAIEVLSNDTDIDGGPKYVAFKSHGAHGSVAITGGGSGLTYTPNSNYCGEDSFTYTLNGGSTATVSVNVTCVDDPPVAVNDSKTLQEDSSATEVNVLANDTDIDGGPKSVASKTEGAHGSVAITGGGSGLTYTPNSNYCGEDSFTYELNGGSTATVSVNVTCVDDPPVAVKDSLTVIEDNGSQVLDVLGNDTDIDGGPKYIASKSAPSHGAVTTIAGGEGLSYTPEPNFCGEDSLSYELNGGSTAAVSVTVTCVDDPPVAVRDAATLAEDSSATSIEVLANDTNIDGGPKEVTSKTNGGHGAVAITGEGTELTYTPDPNYCGEDRFSYTLNGGSTADVFVTVTCVDDPPAAVSDSATTTEDSTAQAIYVLGNDTDIDGGPKEVIAKTNGAHGTVAIVGGGAAVSYVPDANYCGPDSFSYTLNGGSTASVDVTVICVDDPPVAVDDSATMPENSPAQAIAVLANDTDSDGGPKEVVGKTNGAHGTVAITGSGAAVSYTPNANFCGEDSFTYRLNGGSTATVTVSVTCVDQPPVAMDDSKSLSEDSGATEVNVLANDTDVDGGPKEVVAKTNAAHGAVAITAGGSAMSYTPDANYCGPDSFSYILNGGSSASVSVTVSCVDDPPVAVNDAATVTEDASAATINALANDTDIDGGPKEVVAKTDGAHGSVSITGGGLGLTYTPDPNYCGSDLFSYTLNGGSQANVSVTVPCVDDPPVAVNDSETVLENAPAQAIDVLANDTDVDGGPKTVVGKTNGSHGTVALLGAGAGVTYAPESNYCGEDSFTYTLNGGSQATVSVSVTCVQQPPALAPEPPSTNATTSTSTTVTSASTGPVVNVTPGVGVLSGRRHPRIAVKGPYAFFTLTCTRQDSDCAGTVKIVATVPSVTLGPTMKEVILVHGKFRIGSGRSVLVRAKLTPRGLEVLEAKSTLRGVSTKMAIQDTSNHQQGSIKVNLVRRPKASILPEG